MTGPAPWTEVRVCVPIGWHELVADVVARPPCTSAIVGNTSIASPEPPPGFEWVRSFLPAEADDEARREEIARSLAELAATTGEPELGRLRVAFHPLPAEDWANSWKKSWKPFRVGRLAVVPSWRTDPLRETDLRLELEPGGAFGSGRHATTRTCLAVLQQRLRGGERVLDAGSGSGILAVAAALLGARECSGFDIDEHAAVAATELAEKNAVAGICSFRAGGFEGLGAQDTGYDVVLANIYSDIIRAHAGDLCGRLGAGGWFAFSGIPVHHAEATLEAISAAGLEVEEHLRRGRWHTFVGHPAPLVPGLDPTRPGGR